MHTNYKRIGIYVLMTINLSVGFFLLFLMQQYDVLKDMPYLIKSVSRGQPDAILASVLLILAILGPLGTILYALHPTKRWARVWFAVISVLCVPLAIFLILLFTDTFR